jgi:hypothetical protein
MKPLLLFVASAVAFGIVATGAGFALWGEDTLIEASVAFVLAFLPACVTLCWVLFTNQSNPEMRLMAGLGSSGVRMAIALGGWYVLMNQFPSWFGNTMAYWLVMFYMVFLVAEIAILLRLQPKAVESAPRA